MSDWNLAASPLASVDDHSDVGVGAASANTALFMPMKYGQHWEKLAMPILKVARSCLRRSRWGCLSAGRERHRQYHDDGQREIAFHRKILLFTRFWIDRLGMGRITALLLTSFHLAWIKAGRWPASLLAIAACVAPGPRPG